MLEWTKEKKCGLILSMMITNFFLAEAEGKWLFPCKKEATAKIFLKFDQQTFIL